ncbi:MAG: DUF4038 domain-containing protein [Eubacteriales bacterium]|nr:DUF4038 domain-containing protein [Eubacteriales bacterium]
MMRQYETFELTFKGNAPEENWVNVDLSATFRWGDTEKTVKGFYAGEDTYKIRFLPECTGTYKWKVDTSLELNGRLAGEEICEPAAEGRHGKVVVNGLHFAYEDGKRYMPFGTTVYALAHQEDALIAQTFETLAKAPFNKVRLCLFPKSYDFNQNDPQFYAFEKKEEGWNVQHPCMEFWDHFEECLRKMDALGIEADLILFHSYDRWGFSKLTKEEALTYLDYLVRRFAAFPNMWWSLANEYELVTAFEEEWWQEFAEFIYANDPYRHLLSNHNILKLWDFSKPETSHCCIQDNNVIRVPDMQKIYQKPVIYDECCYEGNIMYPWGNISGQEMVNRFWLAVTMGGYCTHGETFCDDNDVLWWAKGGVLKGQSAPRIAFLRELVESLPGDLKYEQTTLEDAVEKAAAGEPEKAANPFLETFGQIVCKESILRQHDLLDKERLVMGHCNEEAYLRYFRNQCAAQGELWLPEEHKYTVEVIDTWEMTRKEVLHGVSGHVVFDLPGKPGMAALALIEG